MGIKHLSDLKVNDFLSIIQNIETVTITEKLDGSNLFCGRDKYGFYTKYKANGSRNYSIEDYSFDRPSDHYKIFGHIVLSEFEKNRTFRIGDEFETEVLYGTRPNVIQYSSDFFNRIVFLRSVCGDIPISDDEVLEFDESILPNNIPFSTIPAKVSKNPIISIECSGFLKRIISETVQIFQEKRFINGIEITLHDILHWPLNKRYPNKAISLSDIKSARKDLSKYYDRMSFISDQIYFTATNIVGRQMEGLVLANGDITTKVAPRHIFLAKKNFIWAWREIARKSPSMIDDIEKQFNDFIDKGYRDIMGEYTHSFSRYKYKSEEYCDEVIRRTRLVFDEIRRSNDGR